MLWKPSCYFKVPEYIWQQGSPWTCANDFSGVWSDPAAQIVAVKKKIFHLNLSSLYFMLPVLPIQFPSTTSDIFKCNVGFHSCNKLIPLNWYGVIYMSFLEESGIVAQLSEPLTGVSTRTFYIGTFFYDHLLVCTSHDRPFSNIDLHLI